MKRFILIQIILLLAVVSATSQVQNSNIRSVDFANFTYSWPSKWREVPPTFKMVNGELPEERDENGMVKETGVFLGKVEFGDVTGDGLEDAIVTHSLVTGGSAVPHIVYVFTIRSGKPILLWSLTTGDRASGGLRKAYAENGHFVLELNSPEDSRGDCCPVRYVRTTYQWRTKKFRKLKVESLPIPEPN